jgi:biopolymer transport protein ExbB
MHAEGSFSLIRLFTSLAMVGAEWVMWILIGLSVFSIAIMLERGRFYWSLRDDLEKLAREIRDLLRRDDMDAARQRLEKSPSPAALIALAGLNEADRGADAANEAMLGATARSRMGLERNLAFLATVGNNAPFIGLLGTVIGIIQAFDALKDDQGAAAQAARTGAANAAAAVANAGALGATERVMGTIAEALVATAIGLFVAIPAVAAFNFFQRKVRSIVSSGDTLTHVVLAHLRGNAHRSSGPEALEPARISASGRDSGSKGGDKKIPKGEE